MNAITYPPTSNTINNHTLTLNAAPPMTVAEYFAGIGLVRLGLEQAGWSVLFANDFSDDKYSMYAAHFEDAATHYAVQDIFELDATAIPNVTLATASFPCIDLSLAGNQKGLSGKHSSAFWGFVEQIKAKGTNRPQLILLENVTGWLSSNNGQDFRLTIEALNQLGYACDVYCIDAIRFTPQSRQRVFVVGTKTDNANGDILKLIRRPDSAATKALKLAVERNSDLNWHIVDLPELPAKKNSGLSQLVERLAEDDERWWTPDEVQRHLDMMDDTHLQRVQKLAAHDYISYRTMYRRVRNGKQRAEVRSTDTAGCLRTARGGSSRQMLVRAGNNEIRMRVMTPREYARLQGVPDEYPLPPQINQALTGFGDAVCVPVIQWVAEHILNPLLAESM